MFNMISMTLATHLTAWWRPQINVAVEVRTRIKLLMWSQCLVDSPAPRDFVRDSIIGLRVVVTVAAMAVLESSVLSGV